MRVLMVGLNTGYLDVVGRRPDISLHVLEEPTVAAVGEAAGDPRISELRPACYQQSDEFVVEAEKWHSERPFDVVVAGMEYAVEGAHDLAARWGLRSPGPAVRTLCDKLRLREAAQGLGIDQPRFAPATTAADVEDFISDGPVVVKPANRRASVGVVRVDTKAEARAAFVESAGADEGYRTAPRDLVWRHMVEAYVPGTEVSVESVWVGGACTFENVTLKDTVGGRYFTEVGHRVPGPVASDEQATVLAANRRLLAGLDVADGVFHSEWKLDQGRAVLIECAARPPGDLIPQLIEQAYGFDLYEALLSVLAGMPFDFPRKARRAAAVSFFRPAPGRVRRIHGVDELARDPRVFDHFVRLNEGDVVDTFQDSWHRAGYVAVAAPDHEAVELALRDLDDAVRFEVDPV